MKLNNFSDLVRVVIIDDVFVEGDGIKKALEKIQIPSIFHLVKSTKSLKNKLCKNVRLVFLDLKFQDSMSDNPALNASNALSKLRMIVGVKGFYILVIWSENTTEEVATVFKERITTQEGFARPFMTLALNKRGCLKANGEYDAKKIINGLNKQLASSPLLQVFTDWERLISNTVSDLAGDIAGQKDNAELSKTLNSLAEAYAGKGKRKDTPQNALMAFNEVFSGLVSQQIISNRFGGLHEKIGLGWLSDKEKAKLNNFMMFTPDSELGPGSIFKNKKYGKSKEKLVKEIFNLDRVALARDFHKFIPIAIEVTPICNAAQKNGKYRYFLIGLMHPKKYTNGSGNLKEIKIDSSKPHCCSLETIYWCDTHEEIFKLSVNLKLFHSTKLGQYESMNLKLRDNLVIDLQHRVSGYISRPGHVLLQQAPKNE